MKYHANRLASSPLPALVLLAFAASFLLSACNRDLRADRIAARQAIINIGADPRTLDPSLATDVASARAILYFHRGLMVLDEQGRPRHDLAESHFVSPDGLVLEFKLRPARWSNGDPLTADDFVYAWTERVLNPAFGAEGAYQLFYLKGAREFYENPALGAASVGVEAIAPDRLRVTLAAPAPFFTQLLAHHTYFPIPRKYDKEHPNWSQRPETYINIGPYLLREYRPGDVIIAEKNPRFWDAANVALDQVTLRMIEQESTSRIAIENGELDATDGIPRADVDQLRNTPELRFSPQFSTYLLFLNTQKPPLTDVRVRRALGLAIDRKAIVERVLRTGESPALFLTPPRLYKIPPTIDYQDADFERARGLLAEAGFPGGKGFPRLGYIFNTMEAHRQIAQVLQETWKRELGIEVDVQNQEFKVNIDLRRAGNFDISRGGWVADFADPLNFLDLMDSASENNDSHWHDPQYDAMLAAARAETDPVQREAKLREAEAYMIANMPVVPIYTYTNPYLCTPRLAGFVMGPTGMYDPARLRWQ